VLIGVLAAAAVVAVATARSSAPPTNTANPTIEGSTAGPVVGDTLRAGNGQWTGSPTRFAYQWDRCNATGDRQGCLPINGATSQSYKVQKADVDHTLRVRVTATNADGSTTKDSHGTGVVSDDKAPENTAPPTIAGTPSPGSALTAQNGTWKGATSFAYQWQLCDDKGGQCASIGGATGSTYGVRTSDVGHTIRVAVTASNRFGSKSSTTVPTAPVATGATTTTPVGPGCSVAASSLKLPSRLLIDRWSFSPRFVTASTQQFTARIHVSETEKKCSVNGAELWATAIPYNQTNVARGSTAADGWATLTFNLQGGFPANPGRQQILAMLVRATQPGGSVLAGVSTRRALRQNVNLR
jgi:hypothetical protein